MAVIKIKSNPATTGPVYIEDLGFFVDSAGTSEVEFDENEEFQSLRASGDLRRLLTDNLFSGSSTLILNDGTSDIAQDDALDYLPINRFNMH